MLTIGVGCRRGSDAGQIEAAVLAALAALPAGCATAHRVPAPCAAPLRALSCYIARIASLVEKADEPGLLAFCAKHRLTLHCFDRATLANVAIASSPSAQALHHVGLPGVCEAAALRAVPGGQLLLPKRVLGGVTVAIAAPVNDTTNWQGMA